MLMWECEVSGLSGKAHRNTYDTVCVSKSWSLHPTDSSRHYNCHPPQATRNSLWSNLLFSYNFISISFLQEVWLNSRSPLCPVNQTASLINLLIPHINVFITEYSEGERTAALFMEISKDFISFWGGFITDRGPILLLFLSTLFIICIIDSERQTF